MVENDGLKIHSAGINTAGSNPATSTLKRTAHYLKAVRKSETINNIIIVDTETSINKKENKEEQTFRMGYAIHLSRHDNKWYQKGYELNTIEDFWYLIDKYNWNKTKLWIFAHNMAFDYTILKIDTYLASRNLEIDMRVVESSLFIVKARNLIFTSSTNYYKQKLEELGIIFGLSKMEHPDFNNCTDEELKPYNKRDTEVLTKIIIDHISFIKENDLGCLQLTIASQAFSAFKHKFLKHKVLVHTYDNILSLEQDSYRGGRSEAFKLGKFYDIYKLDVNSMYPYVMKYQKYPIKPIFKNLIKNVNLEMLKNSINNDFFVLANCNINMIEPVIACKRNKKLIFPVGKIKQTITSPEIKYILEHPELGKIIKINDYIEYESAQIFNDYVDFFYKIKTDSNNEAIKTMAKLFLNSCYGKFGQHYSSVQTPLKDEKQIQLIKDIMKDFKTLEYKTPGHKYLNLGGIIYDIGKKDELSRDSCPIISSAVTSFARITLYDIINSANKKNVIYCDTDSVFVTKEGYKNLIKADKIDSKELGKLKLEETGNCEIFGAKDYIFNKIVKVKGITKKAEKLSENTYKQLEFQTRNSRYSSGTPDGIVIVEEITKTLSRTYNKGIVIDGNVYPFYLEEW